MAKTKKEITTGLKVTLIKSLIGRTEPHRATVKGRGMINAVNYLLKVEKI